MRCLGLVDSPVRLCVSDLSVMRSRLNVALSVCSMAELARLCR